MSKQRRDFGLENLKEACHELESFLADPSKLDTLPAGKKVKVIALPLDDPQLLAHNLQVVARDIARHMPPGTKFNISVQKASGKRASKSEAAEDAPEWQMASTAT